MTTFVATIHLGNILALPTIIVNAYTIHIIILITIAQNPSVMIRFVRYGKGITASVGAIVLFLVSHILKNAKKIKAMLQIIVNLEKKLINFICLF